MPFLIEGAFAAAENGHVTMQRRVLIVVVRPDRRPRVLNGVAKGNNCVVLATMVLLDRLFVEFDGADLALVDVVAAILLGLRRILCC